MNETVMQEPQVKAEFNQAREAAALIPRSSTGIEAQNLAQQLDVAKYIASGGFMIPKHFRGNVGAVLLAMDLADRWGFSAIQVIRMIYEVNGQMGMMGQLVHAIIEKFAPLQTRLRITFEGEGENRVCIVTGRFKNEADDCEYRSPPFKDIQPKNSPLWKTDPDQQQSYLSVSRWARRFSPATLMGIYSKEELEDAGAQYIGPEQAKDITPLDPGASLHERLMAAGKGEDGFRDGVVEAGLNAPLAPEATEQDSSHGAAPPQAHEPKPASGQVQASSGAGTLQSSAAPLDETASAEGGPQATASEHSAPESGAGGLPDGLRPDWKAAYAQVLGTVQKIGKLSVEAAKFWEPYGYAKIKASEHAEAEKAIYRAFVDHFGAANAEKRNAVLKDLGAVQ